MILQHLSHSLIENTLKRLKIDVHYFKANLKPGTFIEVVLVAFIKFQY